MCLQIIKQTNIFFTDGELSFSGRIQILEDGSLLIAKVRSTDHGKYTCIRANEAGSISGSGILSVLVRTQIIQPPVDSKVILGHIASLTCKVSSDRNVAFQVQLIKKKSQKILDPGLPKAQVIIFKHRG